MSKNTRLSTSDLSTGARDPILNMTESSANDGGVSRDGTILHGREEEQSVQPKPNYYQIALFMAVIILTQFASKFVPAQQINGILSVKFGWDKQQKDDNFQYILFSDTVGKLLGSLISGKVIKYGRRRALLIGLTISIFGNSLEQVMIFPVYFLGNTIKGFAYGINVVSEHRMMEEIVPGSILGLCMSFYVCMHYLSEFLGGLCTDILPPDDDTEALAEN